MHVVIVETEGPMRNYSNSNNQTSKGVLVNCMQMLTLSPKPLSHRRALHNNTNQRFYGYIRLLPMRLFIPTKMDLLHYHGYTHSRQSRMMYLLPQHQASVGGSDPCLYSPTQVQVTRIYVIRSYTLVLIQISHVLTWPLSVPRYLFWSLGLCGVLHVYTPYWECLVLSG